MTGGDAEARPGVSRKSSFKVTPGKQRFVAAVNPSRMNQPKSGKTRRPDPCFTFKKPKKNLGETSQSQDQTLFVN